MLHNNVKNKPKLMDSYKIIDISFILLAALLDLEPRYQLLSQLALSRAAS